MSWWVTVPGGQPLGPVSTDNLLRGISAGKVPSEALVCRVGDEEWSPLSGIQRFADAFAVRSLDRYVGAPFNSSSSDRPPFVEPETVEPAHRSSAPPRGSVPPSRAGGDQRE